MFALEIIKRLNDLADRHCVLCARSACLYPGNEVDVQDYEVNGEVTARLCSRCAGRLNSACGVPVQLAAYRRARRENEVA